MHADPDKSKPAPQHPVIVSGFVTDPPELSVGWAAGAGFAAFHGVNANNPEVENLFLLPAVPGDRHWFGADSPVLGSGFRLNRRFDFAEAKNNLLDATLPSPVEVIS